MSEQNRRLRAAGIAALAWAGLAAVWCVLVPGGAAELPQGVPGTLRSLLVLPLAEELVFRGALLRLLRPLGEHPANLCQAVLFAALHGTLTEKCYALGMGLIFGWAAEQTDSPAPGVVLHILNNGLVLARALAERGMGTLQSRNRFSSRFQGLSFRSQFYPYQTHEACKGQATTKGMQ